MDINASMDSNLTHACGCSMCASDENTVSTQMMLQENEGAEAITYPSGDLDPTNTADDILTGYSHGSGDGSPITINYAFHTGYQSYWSQDGSFQYSSSGMTEFSSTQKSAVNQILDMLESFTNITFVQTSDSSQADIGFINANASNGSTTLGGSAYYPTGWDGAGDVFVNKTFWGYDGTASEGDTNFYILLHEIGHALGLEHTFSAGLTGAENTEQYSVMAYDNSPWGGTYAESYMLYDIYSLQQLYGANTSYNAGSDVYNLRSGDAYTIWDGGGATDTLNGSGISSGMVINLNAGTFSSVGATDNIALAYGTIIENAMGGSGNDAIYGNEVSNYIIANGGNDTIYASEGDDNLDAGAGTDTVVYNSDLSDFVFTFVNSSTVYVQDINGSYGTDTLYGFENYDFNGTVYDYAGLVANGATAAVDEIRMKLFWGEGKATVWSSNISDLTYTASDLGMGGANGGILRVNRSVGDLTLTVLQNVSMDVLRVDGSTDLDIININGTNSSVSALVYAGVGNDIVTVASGLSGSHELYGGAGNDELTVYAGNSDLHGEAGNDTLTGGTGADRLYGGEGDDLIYGNAGEDLIFGNDGNDTVYGGNSNDEIYGLDGDDILYGDAGVDNISGGIGNDTIYGGNDADRLYGEEGQDTLYGGAGNDRLYGQEDNDTLYGGDGRDKLYGHAGTDTIYGEGGKDYLYGMDDNDIMYGGDNVDSLYGNAGEDTLIGGNGKDYLYGNEDSDIFGFTAIDGSVDRLQDFTLYGAEADRINITDLLTGFNEATDDINEFVNFAYRDATRTDLFIDTDGGGNNWVAVAMIKSSDFSGVDAADMLANGQLIVDQTLL